MLALCAFQHLIVARISVACKMTDVGDIHDTLNVKSCKAQIFFENILHNIAAQIAYMSVMIHGRTAGVHTCLTCLARNEFFFFTRQRII